MEGQNEWFPGIFFLLYALTGNVLPSNILLPGNFVVLFLLLFFFTSTSSSSSSYSCSCSTSSSSSSNNINQ